LAKNEAFVGYPKRLGGLGFGQFLGGLVSPSLAQTPPMPAASYENMIGSRISS